MIKCVIWDLDNTLLDGVYLESPDQPPAPNPVLSTLLADLAGRGILHAIASRNPPEACRYAALATGHAFAASQCGWGAKSAAIAAIRAELGLAADAVAFVDDDAMERAEVSFNLPDVLVLAPEDMPEAAGWPQFSPSVVTAEARRRGELYLQRRARQEEARAFGGSRDEFLRFSQTQVTITRATAGDLARLHELSVRTHQFNSTGMPVPAEEFAALLGSAGHQVITVRLADRFGDDGMVGGLVLATSEPASMAGPAADDVLPCARPRGHRRGADLGLPQRACGRRGPGHGALRGQLPQCSAQDRTDRCRVPHQLAGWSRPGRRLSEGPQPAAGRATQLGGLVTADLAGVTSELRALLAELTGDSRPFEAPPETALLRDGIGLDSLGGAVLLTQIERRYGVDIAGEDLNLDALASIGALAAYLAARLGPR